MNLVKIDTNKLMKMIEEYKLLHNDTICCCVDEKMEIEHPIILMNEETLNSIRMDSPIKITIGYKCCNIFCGCHIAIADWLPFGEVILR